MIGFLDLQMSDFSTRFCSLAREEPLAQLVHLVVFITGRISEIKPNRSHYERESSTAVEYAGLTVTGCLQ